jgi:acyl-CoA thioesterase-1
MPKTTHRYNAAILDRQLNIGNVLIKLGLSFVLITTIMFLNILNASIANAQSETKIKKIVFFGDSLVAGYNLPANAGVVGQLQLALKKKGYDIELVNAGVSGDTTSAGLQRLDWSVGDNVDAVFLELGANDALRGSSPENAEENLIEIIERLKAKNIAIFLAGMFAPPNMGEDYVNKFNSIYPHLAQKYDLPFYPFFMEGIANRPHLLQQDGLHPNEDGVAEMVKRLLPFFEKQLKTKD